MDITQQAIDLRAKQDENQPILPKATQTFWFDGDSSAVDFVLPIGWKPTSVFVDGLLNRPGTGNDYTTSFDGFLWKITMAVAPAVVSIAVGGEEI